MRQLFKLFGNFQRKSISAFNVICPCASNTAHGQCRVLWTICIWDEVLTCSNITSALVQGVGWSCFGSRCECCPSWLPNQMISLILIYLDFYVDHLFLYFYFYISIPKWPRNIVQQCASVVPVWLVGMCSKHEVNITPVFVSALGVRLGSPSNLRSGKPQVVSRQSLGPPSPHCYRHHHHQVHQHNTSVIVNINLISILWELISI